MNQSATQLARGPFLQQVLLKAIAAWRYGLVILTLSIYAALAPWGYAFFALLVIIPMPAMTRASILQACMRTGFASLHTWITLLRLVDVRYQVRRADLPEGPAVVVANHPTLLDVTAIQRLVGLSCSIVKPAIYRLWWLKPLLDGARQIEGASNPIGTVRVVERAAERLESGMSVIIFPEGTRTEDGREMPFHRLAFEIACRAGVPVVPLKIACEPPYLSKSQPLFRLPSQMPVLSVSALPPVHPEQFDGDSRRMSDHVRSLYRG